MSCRLGLRIGESFAELRGLSDSSAFPPIQKRWYLPKKSLGDGLRETFQSLGENADSGLLQIVTGPGFGPAFSGRTDHAIARQQGPSPAFLVTAGFESWLKIQQSLASPAFTLTPERVSLPVPDDQIFGINERMGADGKVLSALQMDELEFLVSKLELLKIKRVVIGFLHADANPEHEDQAARFLRERGFLVTTSHSFKEAADEASRWRLAIECSFSESAAEEERGMIEDVLKSALGENRSSWQVRVWTAQGPVDWAAISPSSARGGSDHALSELARKRESALTLHFGLESFVALVNRGSQREILALPVQPTRRIEVGPWSVPTFGSEDRGYEPGPMLFGKSHHLSLLDVLYVRDRLEEIEGFTPLVSERTRPRILEALFTLGKTIPTQKSRGTIDAKDVAEDLETFFIDRVAGSIARLGAQGAVSVTGALAPSILPLLKKRRPDLAFAWDPEFAWAGADSCLADQDVVLKVLSPRRNTK